MYENIFCLSVMFMATLVAMVIVIDSDAGGDSDGNNDGDSNADRDSLCVYRSQAGKYEYRHVMRLIWLDRILGENAQSSRVRKRTKV